jgi:hypothetical protein
VKIWVQKVKGGGMGGQRLISAHSRASMREALDVRRVDDHTAHGRKEDKSFLMLPALNRGYPGFAADAVGS